MPFYPSTSISAPSCALRVCLFIVRFFHGWRERFLQSMHSFYENNVRASFAFLSFLRLLLDIWIFYSLILSICHASMFAVSFHMMCCSHTGAPTGTLLFDSGTFLRVAAKMKVASLFGALVASAISLVAAEVKVGNVCWLIALVGFSCMSGLHPRASCPYA